MHEKRSFPRRPAFIPVRIDAPDRENRVGVTRNVSARGALFHSFSRYQVGDRVRLTFRSKAEEEPEPEPEHPQVEGTVVRVETENPRLGGSFPHLAAVKFDGPLETSE